MRSIFLKALVAAAITVVCAAQQPPKTAGDKTSNTGTSAGSARFTLECNKLPFDNIATKPDPFAECGNCGVLSQSESSSSLKGPAKTAQSHAKNNFCADTSKITVVTAANLRDLQKQAAANKPVKKDLPDRSQLHGTINGRSIKEGDVVRLVAWVKDAHLSDCGGGEAVNCDTGGSAHNDVHIVLVDPTSGGRNQDECSSVTAEMSPHFRPIAWSQLDQKIPSNNVIRVTGPLFFDNAHEPCAGLTTTKADAAPLRSSLWEIHPVYQFEVCANTDATKCDANSRDAALWKPYDQWVRDPHSQTEATTFSEGCKNPGSPATGSIPAQCPTKRPPH
jgi:hypothetical protein